LTEAASLVLTEARFPRLAGTVPSEAIRELDSVRVVL